MQLSEVGRSKITLNAPEDWSGKLRLRIPSWTTEFQVSLDGKQLPNITDDPGYYDINLTTSANYEVEIQFDIPIVRELFTETNEELKKYLEPGTEDNFIQFGSFKVYFAGYIFKKGPEAYLLMLEVWIRQILTGYFHKMK